MKSFIICFSFIASFLFYPMLGNVLAQDITISITPTCANTNEGVIEIIVVTEDYSPPFNFDWSDALGNPIPLQQISQDPISGTSTVIGLGIGSYCVSVTSADGCSANSCDIIVEALPTPVINSITPICICPGQYGSAHATVTGGSGDYSYLWTNISSDETTTGANPELTEVGD
jgi:hypothetical protein